MTWRVILWDELIALGCEFNFANIALISSIWNISKLFRDLCIEENMLRDMLLWPVKV